jgi:tRNA threonylcarbamoyladenosine biosynthesis protein TsaB
MLVLSIDSSSSAASVALMSDTKLISEITLNDKKQHSVLLMTLVDEILKSNSCNLSDLDGFVISKGPGSFTGLRIGMATVKDLAMGSKKPCISISSLDGLAYNVNAFNGIICPMMDALRGNIYTCIFKSVNGNLKKIIDYDVLSLEELKFKIQELNENVILVGDGCDKHRDWLKENIPNCLFAPNHSNFTKASSLGELGIEILKDGICEDLNGFAPLYLRKSQAEREYDKKMGLE